MREGCSHEVHLSRDLSEVGEGPPDERRKSVSGRREGQCHGPEAGVKGSLCGMFKEPNGGLSV